ncbi:MAG: hypothetical protein JSV52_02025 [Candidatus Zixiibacteriota bacterium]|nr:MAG: hypothetical protein JSV52_02025 [candidate division Zixibacteria bacterium]
MTILGLGRLTIHTRFSRAEILDHIISLNDSARMPTWMPFRWMVGRKNRRANPDARFQGIVTADRFFLTRVERDTWLQLAVIQGRVRDYLGGSLVRIWIRPSLPTALLLVIFFAVTCNAVVGLIPQLLDNRTLGKALFAMIILALLWVFPIVIYNRLFRDEKRYWQDTLERVGPPG